MVILIRFYEFGMILAGSGKLKLTQILSRSIRFEITSAAIIPVIPEEFSSSG